MGGDIGILFIKLRVRIILYSIVIESDMKVLFIRFYLYK